MTVSFLIVVMFISWGRFVPSSLFYNDASLNVAIYNLALRRHIPEILHYDFPYVVFGTIGRIHVRGILESHHLVVALCHIVNCGYPVSSFRVNGFAVNESRDELSVLANP